MIATLPLYDLPELHAATDRLWEALAAALRGEGMGDVPAALARDRDPAAMWSDPRLVFGQICGYPLEQTFADQLEVVATPCYRAPGCEGPCYRSFLVVPISSRASHVAALRGARCAVNELTSHSGMNALRAHLAPFARRGRFFAEVRLTGSHRRSLELLTSGEVDLAAIDCVTYALLAGVDPGLIAVTRILAETTAAPAPPYVIRRRDPARRARTVAALRRVMDDPRLADVRAALLLDGIEVLPEGAYAGVRDFETQAARLGYPVVA